MRPHALVLLPLTWGALAAQDPSPHQMTHWGLVLQTPGMTSVSVTEHTYPTSDDAELAFSLYRGSQTDRAAPVVIVLSLGSAPDTYRRPQYTDWARLLASEGLVAVTLQSRWERHEEDVPALLHHLRTNARTLRLHADRVGAWACSGVVGAAFDTLVEPGLGISAMAFYYGAPHGGEAPSDTSFLLVRAGKDNADLNARLGALAERAARSGSDVALIDYPQGHHAFDILDDAPRSRQILRRTAAYFRDVLADGDRDAAPPATARNALAHWSAGEWAEAAEAYRTHTDTHPEDPIGWYRLASCLMRIDELEQALHPLDRAAELDYRRADCLYNAACVHALGGRTDEALASLEAAIDAGFDDGRHMRADPDLASLRSHPRFESLLGRLGRNGAR